MFHGQGAVTENMKEDITQYFRQADQALNKLLPNKSAPLVLTGVEHLLPLYRQINTYPTLMEANIPGNPERQNEKSLHDKALAIVQPWFLRAQEQAAAKYRQSAGTGHTSTDLAEILLAANSGRVESLFVAIGVQLWGAFNAATRSVELHNQPQPGDDDLINLAAMFSFLNSGTVYAVTPDQMPDAACIAALLRY